MAKPDRPAGPETVAGGHNADNDNQGLPTFSSRDWVASAEALAERRPDVAIVGAPFDINTTYRPGARFGPRALRSAAYDPGTYHLDLGLDIFEWLDVVDAGDAYCPHGQSARSHSNIESKVTDVLKADAFPVVIGGDHSITYPSATAVARKYGWGKVGLLHFDAHADTAPDSYGSPIGQGSPMRRLIEDGVVPGRNVVQVGLRGYWPGADVLAWMAEQGVRIHTMDAIDRHGLQRVLDQAIDEVRDGVEHVYVSLDIDVLDPSVAPGTGGLEPGGLTTRELLPALRRVAAEAEICGMDVVEVSPLLDNRSRITAIAAHRAVLEALTGMAMRRLGMASGDSVYETR